MKNLRGAFAFRAEFRHVCHEKGNNSGGSEPGDI